MRGVRQTCTLGRDGVRKCVDGCAKNWFAENLHLFRDFNVTEKQWTDEGQASQRVRSCTVSLVGEVLRIASASKEQQGWGRKQDACMLEEERVQVTRKVQLAAKNAASEELGKMRTGLVESWVWGALHRT